MDPKDFMFDGIDNSTATKASGTVNGQQFIIQNCKVGCGCEDTLLITASEIDFSKANWLYLIILRRLPLTIVQTARY